MPGKIRQYFKDKKDDVQDYAGGSGVIGKLILALVVVYLLVALVAAFLGVYVGCETGVGCSGAPARRPSEASPMPRVRRLHPALWRPSARRPRGNGAAAHRSLLGRSGTRQV